MSTDPSLIAEYSALDRAAWLALGAERGWCSKPVCCTHDEVPITASESDAFDTGDDPCIHALRLWGEA